MNSNRNIEILVGVLFLTATATFATSDTIIGSIIDDSDYLSNVSENQTQVIIGALLAFIDGIAIVFIAVMMYPILKKHNEPIALGYVGLRVVEFAIIIIYIISSLLLINLSEEYVSAGAPDGSYFQTLGTLFLAVRYWTLMIIYLFNGLAGLMFAYLLYQSKLIPRLLSVLGLIGYALLLPGTVLDMLGQVNVNQGVGLIVLLPGGLFELILPIWLFVKGFSSID